MTVEWHAVVKDKYHTTPTIMQLTARPQ